MQTRLTILMASTFLSAHIAAGDFDRSALHDNLKWIAASPDAREIFTPEQIGQLRDLLGNDVKMEALEQILKAKTQLEININPESKLSISRTNAATPKTSCGAFNYWLIRIDNEAFVTAPLKALPADSFTEKWVSISAMDRPLTGAAVEYRILKFKPDTSDPIELSLRFNAGPWTHDLGNRSKVPILLLCDTGAGSDRPK